MSDDTEFLPETPSQTAGPYLHIGCLPNLCAIEGIYPEDLGQCPVDQSASGERIRVTGYIYDGAGAALTDALVETWQADAAGLYSSPLETRGAADPGVSGWARFGCDPQGGEFALQTIKPGQVPYADGRLQAPHISLWIIARGINIGLQTRLYFDDEAGANATDPLLNLVEPAARRQTLIASGDGNGNYRFDIRLQGDAETVFLDI